MNNIDIFKKLCLYSVPSGRENWAYPLIKNIFGEYGSISISKLNNLYVHKKGQRDDSLLVMAHIDEVFLIITEILDNGLLKFKSYGIDIKTLISKEVKVHGKKDVLGIINYEDKNENLKESTLFIDTGYDKDYLENIISIGDYVTLKKEFYTLKNNNITCKSIDNRAGIMAMYECINELKNSKHDFNAYFVCSSQEELGHRGAKSACYDIKPKLAVVVDVTFDGGNLGDNERENKLGLGPVICIGPNIHPKLVQKFINLGENYNIPYQLEVESGNTGTDAWDIQTAYEGVPTILISIPIKYMHTSVEIVNMNDVKYLGILIARFIENLKQEDLEGLLCF
ncbi:putative aminopeptidase YsdC [Clostridium acetireducens DSM 10703]|uniref:Putative aminopeptidase YsdC n=1 Tax=Clostridium acetireducens DSM 10703 TaxID=1121290 RepID=A0A1E8EVF8_9CLOT|nr:M42 family peptidase [Clostridium acetireducens]OFH99505.1 putative aminopeptidase YsdC [Clostridium acetireducens DSM 10703]